MDRFITREPRNDRDYVQQHGNRMMSYPPNASSTQNNYMPPEIYYGGYDAEFSGSGSMQHGGGSGGSGGGGGRYGTMGMGVGGMGGVGAAGGAPQMGMPLYASTPMYPDQTQVVSGINQQYLAAYADNRATVIAGQQPQRMQNDQSSYNPTHNPMVTANYNYRSFSGPDGAKTFVPQMVANNSQQQTNQFRPEEHSQTNKSLPETQKFTARDSQNISLTGVKSSWQNQQNASQTAPVKQSTEVTFIKNEFQNPVKTRFDKLKELHRSGPRAFSGPVEKVLKWHKSLQDLGLLIIYEVVAKCVSVRQGEWCSKHLVVRDDQGPAMQVVYYEIDFLLPELKPPCTVRVVGRMVTGTSRLHAFSVRPAAGDDVATLPRRAAVAAHHVAKLCSQYSSNAV